MYIFSVYGCLCCTCKKCYNNDKSIDLDKDDVKKDNEFYKPKKKEKKQIIKKEIDEKLLQDYEVCNDMVFYKWHSNNCTVKSTLINLTILFNKPKILNDWINSNNEFLKTLAEIFVRYNNKDTSKDDVSIFFHAVEKYYIDYYNTNIKIQRKKENFDEDFIKTVGHFIEIFKTYISGKFNNKKDYCDKEYLAKNVDMLEFKKFTDYNSSFNTNMIIDDIISKIYNINYEVHNGANIFQLDDVIYSDDILNDEDFDKILYIELDLEYSKKISHKCTIYKKENKYYLENCDTVIRITKELVQKCYQNNYFQPIIDIYIKNGGIIYKCRELLTKVGYAEYKNIKKNDLVYNLCKNDILYYYNYHPNGFNYDIKENSISYNISQDEVKKIFKELNIVKH